MIDYGLDDQDSIPGKSRESYLLVTASRPAIEPMNIQSNGYQGMKLTTHLHLVLRLRSNSQYVLFKC
jgi:hypothetical protein